MYSIGILEDNLSLRQTVEDYLRSSESYSIAFSEGAYKDISDKDYETAPDFILLDNHLADVLGIDIIADIKIKFPSSQIIVITGDKTDDFLIKAIENGASSYLYKPFKMADLQNAIQLVNETGSFLKPEVLTKLLGLINQKKSKPEFSKKELLTQREVDILELIKKGCTYKEISSELNISFHTVNHHLKNLYVKLDVNSKVELVAKYLL